MSPGSPNKKKIICILENYLRRVSGHVFRIVTNLNYTRMVSGHHFRIVINLNFVEFVNRFKMFLLMSYCMDHAQTIMIYTGGATWLNTLGAFSKHHLCVCGGGYEKKEVVARCFRGVWRQWLLKG